MTAFDLIIRNGEIHDGGGGDAFHGDIGVSGDRITQIGRISATATTEIDARGQIVTPGFVDVHTHYDGQAMWENRMVPSSNHGVTSVVMGNCGVGFAPCKPDQHDLLVALMEGVEDIPEVVMTAGLPWNWETFPQYLDALAQRQFDVDLAAQVPHSALRVYVMGERGAMREPPTSDDLARMRALTAEAVRAGALGVTTSRNLLHRTRAGALAPSLHSEEAELQALAGGLKDAGSGVFQLIANLENGAESEFGLMTRLARTAGRPLSFSLMQLPMGDPDNWRHYLRHLEAANAEGLAIKGQVFPRPVGILLGLDLSFNPFSLHPSFRKLANLPLAQKLAALRDKALRAQLLSEKAADTNPFSLAIVNSFGASFVLGDPPNYAPDPAQSIKNRAAAANMTPHEFVYDLLLENDGETILYIPGANYRAFNLEAAQEMANHPDTLLGLGDGGAHYGMICDASFPTFYLEKLLQNAAPARGTTLGAAIAALTAEPARAVGLQDRGRLAVGYKADLNVIDPARLRLKAPTVAHDLPAGGRRLRQEAEGFAATIKSGVVTYREGLATGALPGRLVRGEQKAVVLF